MTKYWIIVAAIIMCVPFGSQAQQKKLTDLTELDLATAQTIALRDNPGLAAAHERVVQANERLKQARALYYPSIDLQSSLGLTRLPENLSIRGQQIASGASTIETTTLNLSASWIAFDGFARKFTNRIAELGVGESFLAKRDGQRLLLQAVAESYYGAQLAAYNIEIAEADEAFNKRQLEDARISYDQGAVALSTVLNFEIQVNLAKSNILEAERQYQVTLYTLAILMGVEDAELPKNIELSSLAMIEQNDYRKPEIVNLLTKAFLLRPDILQLEQAEQRSRLNIENTKSNYYPEVVLQGSIDGENSEDYGLEREDFGSTIAVTLSYNLFRGWADEAGVAEAVAVHRESTHSLQEQRNQVQFEVREAVADLELAQKQLLLQQETTELVGKTRELVEVGYSAGQESLVRLNEAQRDMVRSQSNLALALVGLYRLRYVLDTATGSTLENVANN